MANAATAALHVLRSHYQRVLASPDSAERHAIAAAGAWRLAAELLAADVPHARRAADRLADGVKTLEAIADGKATVDILPARIEAITTELRADTEEANADV